MDEADKDPSDDQDEAQHPEQMQLMMPSSVYGDDVVGLVLEALVAQELELRKGQANDALEKLHLALAHTSLLWHWDRVRKSLEWKAHILLANLCCRSAIFVLSIIAA